MLPSNIVLRAPRWITQTMRIGRCGRNDGWHTYVSRPGGKGVLTSQYGNPGTSGLRIVEQQSHEEENKKPSWSNLLEGTPTVEGKKVCAEQKFVQKCEVKQSNKNYRVVLAYL